MESYEVCPIPRTRKRGFRTMRNKCKTKVKMASESKTDRRRLEFLSVVSAKICCIYVWNMVKEHQFSFKQKYGSDMFCFVSEGSIEVE